MSIGLQLANFNAFTEEFEGQSGFASQSVYMTRSLILQTSDSLPHNCESLLIGCGQRLEDTPRMENGELAKFVIIKPFDLVLVGTVGKMPVVWLNPR